MLTGTGDRHRGRGTGDRGRHGTGDRSRLGEEGVDVGEFATWRIERVIAATR